MANGDAVLQDHVRRLRELAGFGGKSAPLVAKAVEAETRKNAARGVGPDGKPWQLTKEGKKPLQDVVPEVRAVGTTVVMRLKGHRARHHIGAVQGKIKREILPNKRIPETMTRAIDKVITGEFGRIMGTDE